MARERTLKITILGDASSARRALSSTATGTTTLTGRMSSGISKFQAYAAGFAVVGTAAVAAGKYILDAAMEQERVAAQTDAVLKSTGKEAGITADQISNLAGQIRDYSGQSDEAIQSAENVLLTFTNVHDEVGKGNKIFTRATKAIADVSVALGQDLQGSAIQVGKALNDPIRGITALRRVGVSFTEAQQEVITKLVETGKTAEAQRLILKELRKEFGGSARAAGETLSGKLNILKEKFGDVAEQIGLKVLPYLTKFADWILAHEKDIKNIANTVGKVLAVAFRVLEIHVKAVLFQVNLLISGIEKLIALKNQLMELGSLGDDAAAAAANVPGLQDYLNSPSYSPSGVGKNAGKSPSTGNTTSSTGKPNLRATIQVVNVVNGRRIQSENTRRDILLGTP